jgi:4-aminobutyrate aminotransferase-like enzyme
VLTKTFLICSKTHLERREKMSYNKEELLNIADKHLMNAWGRVPIVFTEGKGVWLNDIDGKKYIDCTAQAWTLNCGHQHPKIIKAAKEQLEKLAYINLCYDIPVRNLLIKKLAEIAPGELGQKQIFATSGSEACEIAFQLAAKYNQGQNIICLSNSYHGRTFGAIAASFGMNSPKKGIERFLSSGFICMPNYYCYRCYFGLEYPKCGLFCATFIDTMLDRVKYGKIAGIIVEPIQGPGGQIPSPPDYLKKVREICNKHGITLIFDEIQTAFGRCGTMFGAEYYGAIPDIMTISKAFSSGWPISAVLTNDKYDLFKPNAEYIITTAAHPVLCASALATIEVLKEEKLLENATKMGKSITKRLNEMAENYELIGDVRGPGLHIGVELVKNRRTKEPAVEETKQFLSQALKNGAIFGGAGAGTELLSVIKVKPPLIINEGEVDIAMNIFEKTLKEISK